MITGLFERQLDYVFFFYGLAFVLLAAICASLRKGAMQRSPWLWLGLFGLTHGISEWLDLLALTIADSSAFATVRLAIVGLSFGFLLEFARVSWNTLTGHRFSRALYFPLLFVVAA